MRQCMQSTAFAFTLAGMAMLGPADGANATPAVVAPATGPASPVVFDRSSPLANSHEIVRRTLSPVAADRVLSYLHDQSQQLPGQSIDLSEERFRLYVPPGDPPVDGYGLIVFIAPWDDGSVPLDWRGVLDRHRMIYVAADRSGNDFNMLWRRLPLALHAYDNVAARYKLNPARIYVAGFSGGSRTAMRAALSYPDVFRGAILNAGSDPFGDAGIAVPPADLFRQFQQRSRIVLVSGAEDLLIDARDAAMLDSAQRLCVAGVSTQPMLHVGHMLMRGSMLEQAIIAIERDRTAEMERRADALAHCRDGIATEIMQGLQQVRALFAQGDRTKAGHALSKIDAQFGGLAAPGSVDLARQLLAK